MENHMAFPICTLTRRSVQMLLNLPPSVHEKVLITLWWGFPLLLDGTEGRSARLARQIGVALSEKTGLTVDYEDERIVKRSVRQTAISRQTLQKAKAIIDQQAAIVILERWFFH